MNRDEFDAVFWSFFIKSVNGLLFGLSKMAYKSKCKEVQFCCLKIVRDTDTEEKEMEFERTHPLTHTESKDHIEKSYNEKRTTYTLHPTPYTTYT
jgi:hypothetical protein